MLFSLSLRSASCSSAPSSRSSLPRFFSLYLVCTYKHSFSLMSERFLFFLRISTLDHKCFVYHFNCMQYSILTSCFHLVVLLFCFNFFSVSNLRIMLPLLDVVLVLQLPVFPFTTHSSGSCIDYGCSLNAAGDLEYVVLHIMYTACGRDLRMCVCACVHTVHMYDLILSLPTLYLLS